MAVSLGQQQALDSDGIRQAMMAQDLVNTDPATLQATFRRCRREMKFLPSVVEIRAIYAEESRRIENEQRQEENRLAEEERKSAMAADPEAFVTIPKLLADDPDFHAVIERAEQRKVIARNPPQRIAEPKVEECPACGVHLPFSMADLRGISSADLRAIADGRDAKAAKQKADVAAVLAAQPAQQAAFEAKARKRASTRSKYKVRRPS